MSFTRTWDDTQPPDSGARNQVALFIRNTKVDILERMNSAFVTDWTADPLVLQPTLSGKVTGKILSVHWSVFSPFPQIIRDQAGPFHDQWTANQVGWPVQNNYILSNNSGEQFVLFAPVMLPQGVTITGVNFYSDPNGVTGNAYGLYKASKTDGSTSTVYTPLTSALSGFSIISKTGLTEVVDNTLAFYFLQVTFGDTNTKLYGADVVYDCPDNTANI